MEAQMDGSVLLTTEEAAEAFRLKAQTLAKWRLTGYGPRYLKISGRVRYTLEDLNEFIARCSTRSTAEVRGRGGVK
jgi:hypothetical protein